MSKWASRAAAHFSEKAQEPTPRTPETHLMGVLGVGSGDIPANDDQVLGVLGVPTKSIPDIQCASGRRLLAMAMRVCDIYGDSPEARSQMVEQISEIPRNQHEELMAHFQSAYGRRAA
jgi:hypothetical protein